MGPAAFERMGSVAGAKIRGVGLAAEVRGVVEAAEVPKEVGRISTFTFKLE